MKGYKYYFNEEAKQFDLIEFDLLSEKDFSHDPESNLEGEENCHNCNKTSALNGVAKMNDKLASGEFTVHKCKDCSKFFIITKDEKRYFAERNLNMPKRCSACRRKRKNNRRP